jgi:hypothetical protein
VIKITIAQASFETIPYTSKKDGSAQQLRKQTAYAHVVDKDGAPGLYPEKFGFLLNRDEAPHAAGEYTMHPSSVEVSDGKLLLRNVRLTPIARKPSAV